MAEPAATGKVSKRSTQKHCLLYLAAMLLSLSAITVVLVLMSQLGSFDGELWSRWSRRHPTRPRAVTTLPEMPEDDRQMAARLFRYLSRPSGAACRRLLRFGGTPSLKLHGMVLNLEGGEMACLDPEFALTGLDCLVYSLRAGGDSSLEAALERYGCSVHSFDAAATEAEAADGPGTIHQAALTEHVTLDELRTSLGHLHEPIAFLSVTAPGAEELVLCRPEALRRVQQLALRLSFSEALSDEARAFALFRRRYGQLLRLQELGFRPFAFEQLDSHGAVNMTVPGLAEPLTSVMEVVFLNAGERAQPTLATSALTLRGLRS
ncbi:uncharacterized protein LOC119098811 [Pollicipes pollicipes]|uniref:uncharacterized protein LOC119098811 n=1 Tax=Pollicipes pollicipes TaxID=41117 RepID=UPI001884F125|nr:uncharacterized protein LOC119098811 [Pollicipes pollicipes]